MFASCSGLGPLPPGTYFIFVMQFWVVSFAAVLSFFVFEQPVCFDCLFLRPAAVIVALLVIAPLVVALY